MQLQLSQRFLPEVQHGNYLSSAGEVQMPPDRECDMNSGRSGEISWKHCVNTQRYDASNRFGRAEREFRKIWWNSKRKFRFQVRAYGVSLRRKAPGGPSNWTRFGRLFDSLLRRAFYSAKNSDYGSSILKIARPNR